MNDQPTAATVDLPPPSNSTLPTARKGLSHSRSKQEGALSEETTTAHVIETGESAFAVSIEVSGHGLVGDEPFAKGGNDLGPAPYDLLLAALGECTAMTVRWYARQQNWPLDRVEVILTHAKGGVEGTSAKADYFAKTIRISGEDLTVEQRDKLIAVAARCPVQRSLEGTPVITTHALS